jgi:hypothetical protein
MPAPGSSGTAGRNVVRGPSLVQIDVGLSRRFAINERSAIEFRGEAFNLLNRAQLGNPLGDVTVPSQIPYYSIDCEQHTNRNRYPQAIAIDASRCFLNGLGIALCHMQMFVTVFSFFYFLRNRSALIH